MKNITWLGDSGVITSNSETYRKNGGPEGMSTYTTMRANMNIC
jgi:hypothetical protein